LQHCPHLSLSWARLSQSMPSCPISFFKMFYSTIPSMPRSSKQLLFFRFPHQIPLCIFIIPQACHMPCPSHLTWFHHPNNIWWHIHIM
jgi:hypothetical protein